METVFEWDQYPDCDNGELTLWPGTRREQRVRMESFEEAQRLASNINAARKGAYAAGRAAGRLAMREEVEDALKVVRL